ncbi:hypothetical protein Trydic_g9172 [Trypoxylus dichotomus]
MFSTFDLKSDYWQVKLEPKNKEKTTFIIRITMKCQFIVMLFSLYNAPTTFQRSTERALRELPCETCLVYVDDVFVLGRTFDEHLRNLEKLQAVGRKKRIPEVLELLLVGTSGSHLQVHKGLEKGLERIVTANGSHHNDVIIRPVFDAGGLCATTLRSLRFKNGKKNNCSGRSLVVLKTFDTKVT